MSELRVAPTRQRRLEYRDNGDLFVNGHRVEVNGLSASFTCLDDWPFKVFIVAQKHAYDDAPVKPYGWVKVNRERTHAAFVPLCEVVGHWWVQTMSNKFWGRQTFYVCEPELVWRWKTL